MADSGEVDTVAGIGHTAEAVAEVADLETSYPVYRGQLTLQVQTPWSQWALVSHSEQLADLWWRETHFTPSPVNPAIQWQRLPEQVASGEQRSFRRMQSCGSGAHRMPSPM